MEGFGGHGRRQEPQPALSASPTEPVPVSSASGNDQAQLLAVAKNAAAMLGAVYQWIDQVNGLGGPVNIAGVAKAHAMIKSLNGNRDRAEKLVMEPLRAAIAKAEGR
jgi:hypothetical protein